MNKITKQPQPAFNAQGFPNIQYHGEAASHGGNWQGGPARVNQPIQQQGKRLSPGVYRMPDGSLGNGRPQPPQRQLPQGAAGMNQPSMQQGIPRPQFNPQGQVFAGGSQGFNEQQPYGIPRGGPNIQQDPAFQRWQAQQQFNQAYNPNQNFMQNMGQGIAQGFQQPMQLWNRTQAPAQPVGILGGYPPGYQGGQ